MANLFRLNIIIRLDYLVSVPNFSSLVYLKVVKKFVKGGTWWGGVGWKVGSKHITSTLVALS